MRSETPMAARTFPFSWRILRGGAYLFIACFVTATAAAQDSHYWNLFYGTEATLLGGTVIGSASDLSATYYNPGMLAVNREKGLVLGASVYTYQRLSVPQSGAKDIVNARIAPAPGLVAGRIPSDSAAIGGIAYSILTRQLLEATLEGHFVGPRDVIGRDGIPEQLTSDLLLNSSLSYTWVGATLFRLLHPGIGIGLTNYVALRYQKTRSAVAGQALMADGTTLYGATRITDVHYYNVGLLWKLGIGIDLRPLSLGLTVTTPAVNLFGSGSVFLSYAANLPDSAGAAPQKTTLLANNQEAVQSHYKTSWAVGAGMGYRIGRTRIHVSAEWYMAVPIFRVLETTSFMGQSDGQQHRIDITDERASVLNAGIGLQYTISPAVSVYGSVVTDFSYVPEETKSNLSLTPWDLLHFSFGTVLSFKMFDLTAGLSFSGGGAPLSNVPWSSVASSLGKVIGTSFDTDISYFGATAILAFTFKL